MSKGALYRWIQEFFQIEVYHPAITFGDDVVLLYRGPTLLLLHGNPTWSFLYRHLVLRLTWQFHCLAPDFLRFGFSRAPVGFDFRPAPQANLLRAFIEAVDLKGAVVKVQD